MKLTTRGSVAAAFVACVATAVAASPAAAGTPPVPSVPVTLPLEHLETVLPVETPELRTGVPVPVPGVPDGPRYAAGRMLPEKVVPAVPFGTQLPETNVELPVKDPLGEDNLGVVRAVAEASDLALTAPGASVGAPVSAPRPHLFGFPEPVLPEVGLAAPMLRGTPAATLFVD